MLNKVKKYRVHFFLVLIISFFQISISHANICPQDIEKNRKAAIPFVPFLMLHPETGKPPLPDETVSLKDKNGKLHNVILIKFLNDLNSLEYFLNQWGYSLRNFDENQILSHTFICTEILEKQKKAIEKRLKIFSLNKMPSYEEWIKQLEDSLKSYKINYPSYDELQRFADSENLEGYLENIPSFEAPKPIVVNQNDNLTFNKQKTWSFEKGEKSKFYIAGRAGYHVGAKKKEVHANAFANLQGAFLNIWDDTILGVSANINAPASKNGKMEARVDLFGSTIFILDDHVDYEKSFTTKKKFERHPLNFNIELVRGTFSKEFSHRFTVGPIPLKLSIGIRGEDRIRWSVEVLPLKIQTYIQHYATFETYAQAAIDIVLVEVGVEGRLVIINLDSRITASAFADFSDFPSICVSLVGTSDLVLLSGDFSIYANIHIPFLSFWKNWKKYSEIRYTLWGFKGYRTKGTFFDYSGKISPAGFSATGDLSVDDVSELLDIDSRLKRNEKIADLEFKVQQKLHETMTFIVNDLRSEKNVNLLKSDSLYQSVENSANSIIDNYQTELLKWAETTHVD